MKPFKAINAGDMSGSLTSSTTAISGVDVVNYLVQWSGTSPVGTISVEVRQNVGIAPDGFNSSWVALDFGETISVSGNTGGHTISIQNQAFSEIRLLYTRSSGVGTMQAVISGSVEGA